MFAWAEALRLRWAIDWSRDAAGVAIHSLPDWVIYSLPNALWAYALTAFMLRLWGRRLTRGSAPWILVGPLLAIGWEVGQSSGLVPGTFDLTDLLFVVLALAAAFAGARPALTPRLGGAHGRRT
jgi:hypothetical protein